MTSHASLSVNSAILWVVIALLVSAGLLLALGLGSVSNRWEERYPALSLCLFVALLFDLIAFAVCLSQQLHHAP